MIGPALLLWVMPVTFTVAPCRVVAEFPVDVASTDPIEERARFELRRCVDEIEVAGYEDRKSSPSLVFETGGPWPRYLSHVGSVLILQSLGGSSDHVYVIAFKSGQPAVVLQTATKDLIQVTQFADHVVVAVPPPTYPDEHGNFPSEPPAKKYSFPLESQSLHVHTIPPID